jgi:hypothetical protein
VTQEERGAGRLTLSAFIAKDRSVKALTKIDPKIALFGTKTAKPF